MNLSPLSDALGAAVEGIDAASLSNDEFAELNGALLTYRMLAIRGQNLSPAEQAAFSSRFGPLEIHDNDRFSHPERQEVLILSNEVDENGSLLGIPDAGDAWHSDLQFKPRTAHVTVLQSVRLPARGGDTDFADMAKAFQALPPNMRESLRSLRGRHSINKLRNPRVTISGARAGAKDFYADKGERFPDQLHPLVRRHPETGEPTLFCSPRFTIGLDGIEETEGQALLDRLFAHQIEDRFVYRHRWREGDLVIWDNRAVNHRACGGVVHPDIRRMHRTTVIGGAPEPY